MYYDFWVKLPEAPGKYVYEKRGETTYVKYEYDRAHRAKEAMDVRAADMAEKAAEQERNPVFAG